MIVPVMDRNKYAMLEHSSASTIVHYTVATVVTMVVALMVVAPTVVAPMVVATEVDS